ncbi:hypothetical protein GGI04_000437 [Coemansia thaxteri]|nr:hypothetical protein GGI04_000437 [Coemansia thaxteri]
MQCNTYTALFGAAAYALSTGDSVNGSGIVSCCYLTMIFRSIVPTVDIPGVDVPRFYLAAARRNAPSLDTVAYHDIVTKQSITYQELEDMCRKVASGLINGLGIASGSTVAIFASNHVHYAALLFGVISTGATCCTISSAVSEGELEHQLADCGAHALFVGNAQLPMLCRVLSRGLVKIPPSRVVVIENYYQGQFTSLYKMLSTAPYLPFYISNEPESAATPAVIIYSSGTTGTSKGVILSHHNLIGNTTAMLTTVDYFIVHERLTESQDKAGREAFRPQRSLAVLPFAHITGLLSTVLNSIALGRTQYILGKYSIEAFLQAVQDYQIETALIVPSIAAQVVNHKHLNSYNLSSFRQLGCGAAPLSSGLQARVSSALQATVGHGYGMTEAGGGVCMMGSYKFAAGSVGFLFSGVEAKIVDVHSKQELGYGQEGELCLRTSTIMMGYINSAEETSKAIDSDGFLHTGDIAYISESNHVYIADRIKEVIKYKGLQVAPTEIEGILGDHPLVSDAAVIGIEDQERGTELPKAYVVLRNTGAGKDQAQAQRVTEELTQWVADRVANHKRLRGGIEIVEAIARSQTGKILRREMRAKHNARHAAKI